MALKILLWFTRILAILSILFMMMFSLDVFTKSGDVSFINQLGGFLKHNLPAFTLIIVLIISWKYEIAAGVVFILIFIVLGILFDSFIGNSGSLIIISPFLLVGILFILHRIISHRRKV